MASVGEELETETFESFVARVRPVLTRALVAGFGVDSGTEAAAEAIAYGWEHWDRLRAMDNPAGYLFRVGQTKAASSRQPLGLPAPDPVKAPWIEPGLPAALERLTEAQRTAVLLVHTFGYSLTEAATTMGVSKSTIQTHLDRGLGGLRRDLGVTL